MIDLYEVLQVDRGAEPEVIVAVYRTLARKNHPDSGGDAGLMASVDQAWAVLGDPARRAAYDAEPGAAGFRPSDSPAVTTDQPATDLRGNGKGRGLAGRLTQQQRAGGSVLDFGRYVGWTVGSLVDHDPDYLEWLARTPIGRPLTAEIDEALGRRAAAAPGPPSSGKQPARRRAFF